MATYRVEIEALAREVYYVDADSPEDAMANWHTGLHDLTEVYGADPVSAELAED